MTKDELTPGMVIETRDGFRYQLLINGDEKVFSGSGNWANVASFNDDLTYSTNEECDVMKVFECAPHYRARQPLDRFDVLIWERSDVSGVC